MHPARGPAQRPQHGSLRCADFMGKKLQRHRPLNGQLKGRTQVITQVGTWLKRQPGGVGVRAVGRQHPRRLAGADLLCKLHLQRGIAGCQRMHLPTCGAALFQWQAEPGLAPGVSQHQQRAPATGQLQQARHFRRQQVDRKGIAEQRLAQAFHADASRHQKSPAWQKYGTGLRPQHHALIRGKRADLARVQQRRLQRRFKRCGQPVGQRG